MEVPAETLRRAYDYAMRLMDETPDGLWIDARAYLALAATVFGIERDSAEMATFLVYAEERFDEEVIGAVL